MDFVQLIKEGKLENTLIDTLDMKFVTLEKDKVVCTMPVGPKTHQPMGLLHGGASVALAETAASIAAFLNIDPEKQYTVGLEINANHLKGKRDGLVTATATPFHIGRSTMVWDIRITDEQGDAICISRCTMAVVTKK